MFVEDDPTNGVQIGSAGASIANAGPIEADGDGVHVASTGGVWSALAFGFGGVRDFDGELTLDPHLPQAWARLALPLRFRDRQLLVTLTHDQETYAMVEGEPLEVTIRGERHELSTAAPLVLAAAGGSAPLGEAAS